MNFNVLVLVIVVVATSMVVPGAEGAEYVVGDSLGWTIPPGGAATYAAWVAKHRFVVNDVIEFNFTTGEDNLAWIFKEDFDNCNITNPAYVYNETVKIHFLGSATYYYTSTFPGHCLKGQKIAVYFAPSQTAPPNPRANAAHDQADSAGLPLSVVSENMQGTKTRFSVINRS